MSMIAMVFAIGSRLRFKGGFVGLQGMGQLVRNYCLYSGVIPQITMLLGPCTGPLAHVPVLSDFLIINEKTGFMWLGGDMESEDAGRAEFQMEKSGQCDLIAESDEEAIELCKKLLDFMPQNCWEKPTDIKATDDPERQEEELLDVMPDDVKALAVAVLAHRVITQEHHSGGTASAAGADVIQEIVEGTPVPL